MQESHLNLISISFVSLQAPAMCGMHCRVRTANEALETLVAEYPVMQASDHPGMVLVCQPLV